MTESEEMSDGERENTSRDNKNVEDARLFFPSTARNREPIFQLLSQYLKPDDHVLEIGSGSGELAVHLLSKIPELTWQPSDPDQRSRDSIGAWRNHMHLSNLLPPLDLNAQDSLSKNLSQQIYDAIVCTNVIHISPWTTTIGLMKAAGKFVRAGGFLYLYGPFKKSNQHTAESNRAFDESLRERDPSWGIRDVSDVESEAANYGLCLEKVHDMPANNFSLIFRKEL